MDGGLTKQIKAKEIYELNFLYNPNDPEQGGKERPVLVFVLTSTKNRFIGLKITKTRRDQNRVKIDYWKEAGLEYQSYVQCDIYDVFEGDTSTKYIGTLRQSDYDKVVLKVNEFYPILKWLNQERRKA